MWNWITMLTQQSKWIRDVEEVYCVGCQQLVSNLFQASLVLLFFSKNFFFYLLYNQGILLTHVNNWKVFHVSFLKTAGTSSLPNEEKWQLDAASNVCTCSPGNRVPESTITMETMRFTGTSPIYTSFLPYLITSLYCSYSSVGIPGQKFMFWSVNFYVTA